jgi:hypothetical protein
MRDAVSSRNKIPIHAEKCGKTSDEFFKFYLEFVDTYIPEWTVSLGETAEDSVLFCPFCGAQVFLCKRKLSDKWKVRKCICEDFLEWFMKGDEHYPNFNAPTSMFKFVPEARQFYMHYRKGFGEGWIPITYCIYCGEPLAEMVAEYGIPSVIADRLDPSEWQGKYKICTKKKVLTENDQLPD